MNDMFRPHSPKSLRPHQEKAIHLIRQSLVRGNKRVVCQAPTGFGKTLTAAKIIEGSLAKGNKVIFTAPAVSLINQTMDAFMAEGITDIGAMQANNPRTNPMARVQVASVQTLARREIPSASLVIVDECHIRSEAVIQMMRDREDVYFIGLSATPWAKGMGLLWQDMVTPCSLQELIDAGYLSRFTAFAPDVPDLSGVSTVAGDYNEAQTADIMEGKALCASVVQTWLEKGQNRPTFCFAVNRAHAARLQAEFEAVGVSAGYCDAFTDPVEMALLERRFRSGEIRIMCSCRKMTTGIDWPVSCIIDAMPTKSEMLHVQKIGRGLRVNSGTEDCLILDHAGNSLRLGLVTDIHHTELDKTEKGKQERKPVAEKLPKECANCGALVNGLTCPFCGHERKPQPGIETVNGELVEIGKKHIPTKAEKQAFWSMALHLDHNRGKGGKLALALYKGKFGVWPRGLEDRMMHPDPAFYNYEKSRRIARAAMRQKNGGQ
jgi:DNA repair protein RadD